MKKIFLTIMILNSLYGFATTQNGINLFEKGEYKKAIDIFKQLSLQNDGLSQAYLGLMYRHGLGVTQDFQKSLDYYKKSCDDGFAIGCEWYQRLKSE
ncbi:tetratricopeptide repeat protein [Aliarcobacter butzleri]|uniref:tetratricopeptide repeat protein n=1 Tax=Aliarcobacter butzleri TaxID=28197 RepID=UPI003AF901FE